MNGPWAPELLELAELAAATPSLDAATALEVLADALAERQIDVGTDAEMWFDGIGDAFAALGPLAAFGAASDPLTPEEVEQIELARGRRIRGRTLDRTFYWARRALALPPRVYRGPVVVMIDGVRVDTMSIDEWTVVHTGRRSGRSFSATVQDADGRTYLVGVDHARDPALRRAKAARDAHARPGFLGTPRSLRAKLKPWER